MVARDAFAEARDDGAGLGVAATAALNAVGSPDLLPDDIAKFVPEIELANAAQKAEEVRATTTARLETEREQAEMTPIPLSQAALLFDPNTGQRVPFGTTPQQARAMGAIPLTSTQVSDRDAVVTSLQTLQEFRTVAGRAFKGVTGIAGSKKNALVLSAGRMDPDSAGYELNVSQGTASALIRALGEKGVLTEGDVSRALRLLPSIWDTESSAQKKLNNG
jgi:hypothetical protein